MNTFWKQGIAPVILLIVAAVVIGGVAGTAKILNDKKSQSVTPPSQTIQVPQDTGGTTQTGQDNPSTGNTKVTITPLITPPQPISLPCQYASFLPGCSAQIQGWQYYQQQQLLQQQQIQQIIQQQQLNQQKQYTNPMANPQINPYANPQINPYANPQINPYANPQINPNYVPGQYNYQNLPPGYR